MFDDDDEADEAAEEDLGDILSKTAEAAEKAVVLVAAVWLFVPLLKSIEEPRGKDVEDVFMDVLRKQRDPRGRISTNSVNNSTSNEKTGRRRKKESKNKASSRCRCRRRKEWCRFSEFSSRFIEKKGVQLVAGGEIRDISLTLFGEVLERLLRRPFRSRLRDLHGASTILLLCSCREIVESPAAWCLCYVSAFRQHTARRRLSPATMAADECRKK